MEFSVPPIMGKESAPDYGLLLSQFLTTKSICKCAVPLYLSVFLFLLMTCRRTSVIWRLLSRASWYISIVKPTMCTSFSNLFYFLVALYMFRTVFPSIIRSLKLYIQHQVYVIQVLYMFRTVSPSTIRSLGLYVQHQVYIRQVLYMFRTVSPSIIRSLRLYIQHQVYIIQVL